MKIIKEFKTFALKGNVADMAVGIIIGAAFGKIVSSLVNDVLMPPLGMMMGGIDFSGFMLVLKEATEGSEKVAIKYGVFLNHVIDFLIVGFSVFILVKGLNNLRNKEEKIEKKVPEPKEDLVLLKEIRDILAKKN